MFGALPYPIVAASLGCLFRAETSPYLALQRDDRPWPLLPCLPEIAIHTYASLPEPFVRLARASREARRTCCVDVPIPCPLTNRTRQMNILEGQEKTRLGRGQSRERGNGERRGHMQSRGMRSCQDRASPKGTVDALWLLGRRGGDPTQDFCCAGSRSGSIGWPGCRDDATPDWEMNRNERSIDRTVGT